MNKKTIKDIAVKGKRVFVRCDFNVPMDENCVITDDRRIVAALDTIKYLSEQGGRIILCSHLGRPKNGFESKFSLLPVSERLSQLLGKKVVLASDVVGADAHAKVEKMKDGEIVLLENVRFHKEEEKNDAEFAKELANLADIYVNDAFGTAHRAHASTEGITKYLETAVAGFLVKKEIEIMGGALTNPRRPFVAILGGAKVSDKIGVINNLLQKVDKLIIGGAMAYTFLVAKGGKVGASKLEADKVELAKELLAKAQAKGVEILLPVDNVVTQTFAADAPSMTADSMNIPDGWMGLDIGEKTQKLFSDALQGAGTVLWNGPMGVFEFQRFAFGTNAIANALSKIDAITIIGGGDSAAAVEQLGYSSKMTHVSTGGGASLEFLEGVVLPGIACLND